MKSMLLGIAILPFVLIVAYNVGRDRGYEVGHQIGYDDGYADARQIESVAMAMGLCHYAELACKGNNK